MTISQQRKTRIKIYNANRNFKTYYLNDQERNETKKFASRKAYDTKFWDLNTKLQNSTRSYCGNSWDAIQEHSKYYEIG